MELLLQSSIFARIGLQCRALTDPQEFENLVQRNMEANCSFNYTSMAHFMSTIALRQIRRLCSHELSQERQIVFQLRQCNSMLQKLLKELCSSFEQPFLLTQHVDIASIDLSQEHIDKILLPDIPKSDVMRIISDVVHVAEQTLET